MKEKKNKEYKVPKRRQPIFTPVKQVLKLFYRKPKIVYLDEKLPDKAIIISNHCSKKGPMALEIYLPVFNVKWGAYEMLGNYKSRFRYLRDVYYMQKKGLGKFSASLHAGFEAIFSKLFYKGMKFLPTYSDGRLMTTINNSMKVLDSGASIMIFPENSNEGYKEEMTEFFPGFVMLAERYLKKGGDAPICPIYYNDKKRVIIVGKQYNIKEFIDKGLDRYQIAEEVRNIVNDLYHKSLNL